MKPTFVLWLSILTCGLAWTMVMAPRLYGLAMLIALCCGTLEYFCFSFLSILQKSLCACEHRLIMEKHLGRYLFPTEVVHHIDGDVINNKLSNLFLFPNQSAHAKFHHILNSNKKLKGGLKQNG
jgi:hypothetical protein